jgi:hypothetical protein
VFLQRHATGFVSEDFEAGEGAGGHREGFLEARVSSCLGAPICPIPLL